MTRKVEISRPYQPRYVGLETVAYLLDCSETTVQEYVRSGFLPPAVKIGNLTRWDWSAVEAAIGGRGAAEGEGEDDLITDIKKAKAARDRAS